jgi:hypothetical protein
MTNYSSIGSYYGTINIGTDESATPFKKAIFGKVNSSTSTEWYSENLTSSFKTTALRVISQSLPSTPPSTVLLAAVNSMSIQTGSNLVDDTPPGGGGRVYCLLDSADPTGKTWVTVLTGAFNVVSSRGTQFCSTGSDKDFILTDWVAPWHVTESSTNYQARVYACWGGGGVAAGPQTVTEISSSNRLAWTFDYDGGVVHFTNPTLTFSFQNFEEYQDNLDSLSSYTDSGWLVLSQTKTTTEHIVVLGGAWASGSLASPTWRPLSDIITAHTGATTASCIAVEGYRYTGRSIYLG